MKPIILMIGLMISNLTSADIYPNPCISELYISSKGRFEVFDIAGKNITHMIPEGVKNGKRVLFLDKLEPGQYILHLNGAVKRFVKIVE